MKRSRYDLARFLDAQDAVFERTTCELAAGEKRSHWMWFIFPQLRGLGFSDMADYYGIAGRSEATDYLAHAVLGPRLIECTTLTLEHQKSALAIFGATDALKFRSCMTLFAAIEDAHSVFMKALCQFYGGKNDVKTLELLGQKGWSQQLVSAHRCKRPGGLTP